MQLVRDFVPARAAFHRGDYHTRRAPPRPASRGPPARAAAPLAGEAARVPDGIAAKYLKRTSFGTRGRRFKSCHSDHYLAPSETPIPTISPTDTPSTFLLPSPALGECGHRGLPCRLIAMRPSA